ncbi:MULTISPECIES: OmpW/AlkL family protein [Rhizobium]|uniref:OmpW family protein n=2 Tax=Rhizobium TaxID=379 RepID=A0A387G0E9_9HYPH|nr:MULTISPECIES: OmpW family protein [Rhizobium]AYG64013.1 OmpW family protein [Rhizobium jaguaris]MDL2403484.1 OmpW family protein [Rhizobium mayense]
MTSNDIARAIVAAAALVAVSTAEAADLPTPQAKAPIRAVANRSPWQMRLRALGVVTTDSGRVDGLPGSDLSFSDTIIPEFDISYFFTENIAAELILGTTYAKVHGGGSISALGEIGKTWLLPPTLTLQYHFTELGAFRPYVGAGVNYTVFYNQSGKTARSLDVKNTFGVALQAGFDYMIDDHWGMNFDAKKIFLRPDFDANVGGAGVSGKAKLDPWLLGAGVTYRF